MPRPCKAQPDQWLLDIDPFESDIIVRSDRGRPVLVDRYGNCVGRIQEDSSFFEDSP